MKTTVVILILLALIQSSFLGINLLALFLISRSLVVDEKSNLYLAFFAGVLLGLLSSINLGFYALGFLVIAMVATLVKRSPLSSNTLSVVPLSFLLLLLLSFLESLFLHQSPNIGVILFSSVLSLIVYLMVRFWEERFIPKEGVKLKV